MILQVVSRRRRWSAAEKLRIVEETLEDHAIISIVARRNGVSPARLGEAWQAPDRPCPLRPMEHHDLRRGPALRRHHRTLGDRRANQGAILQTYVAEILSPTLRKGDIVILDNLGSQQAPAIRNAIRAIGAQLLFLPAYSPDINPIEQVFAKLKHLLRKAAERSKEAVWRRIGTLLDQSTPQECENYFRNSGYGSAQPLPALVIDALTMVVSRYAGA